jgi:hypothetical protein
MPQADRLGGFFIMVNFFEYLTQAQELFDTAVRLRAEANDNGLELQLSREFAERAMLASRLGDHEQCKRQGKRSVRIR